MWLTSVNQHCVILQTLARVIALFDSGAIREWRLMGYDSAYFCFRLRPSVPHPMRAYSSFSAPPFAIVDNLKRLPILNIQ